MSTIMLKVILRRLQPITEELMSEYQAGFNAGRSTNEHIFNLRIISDKYTQYQKPRYHVFIEFKTAFYRILHAALWDAMKTFNINAKLIKIIKGLYEKEIINIPEGKVGKCFAMKIGVRQEFLLSSTLFNSMLEQIINEALLDHEGTISIGGRVITNVRFADIIDD